MCSAWAETPELKKKKNPLLCWRLQLDYWKWILGFLRYWASSTQQLCWWNQRRHFARLTRFYHHNTQLQISPLSPLTATFSGTWGLYSFYLFNFYKAKCINKRREANSVLLCWCPSSLWLVFAIGNSWVRQSLADSLKRPIIIIMWWSVEMGATRLRS